MPKYLVTLFYDSFIEVEVKAENEQDAIVNATIEAGKKKYDSQLLHNVQCGGEPDVEEIE